jgi:2-polyprenyl-3-methyl-5-hydroxy-6-metoxy-1,4-benzoquinol methylase
MPDLEKTIEMWNSDESTVNRYGRGFHWVESPQVLEYIQEMMSGDPAVSWGTHFTQKYLSDKRGHYVGLSLGCGTGQLELALQKQSIFVKLDAIDVADIAIKHAINAAIEANVKINFSVADINTINLPENTYDVIIANSSLHHISNLDHAINQINLSLKPGGVLCICEYIGASQFQYPKNNIDIVNDLIEILPERYRRRVSAQDSQKGFVYPPSVAYMNAHDPSEAIRSAEIVPLLRKNFRVLEDHPFGGTLLHMLLQDLAGNFSQSDPIGNSIIRYLIYIEKILIKNRILDSDFTYMVFGKA